MGSVKPDQQSILSSWSVAWLRNPNHRRSSSSKYCVLMTLNVRNAFNFGRIDPYTYVPSCYRCSYLFSCRLHCLPQNSVFGPILRKNMYNDVLNLPLSEEIIPALIVFGKHVEDAELYSCKAISAIKGWLESIWLAFVEENNGSHRQTPF